MTSPGHTQWIYVIEDPTGDFKPGAQFTTTEFSEGLRRNVWPNGMRIDKNSNQYIVVQRVRRGRKGMLYTKSRLIK